MFQHRPLPTVDAACEVVGEYARLDLRIGGVVLTGAALHGAGGICETTERALQVIRWARADGGKVRVYLVHDAARDEGFDVPARDLEVFNGCEECGRAHDGTECPAEERASLMARLRSESCTDLERTAIEGRLESLAEGEESAETVSTAEPFCACGRRWADCDGSRAKCHRRTRPTTERAPGARPDSERE